MFLSDKGFKQHPTNSESKIFSSWTKRIKVLERSIQQWGAGFERDIWRKGKQRNVITISSVVQWPQETWRMLFTLWPIIALKEKLISFWNSLTDCDNYVQRKIEYISILPKRHTAYDSIVCYLIKDHQMERFSK